jgi:hypothetical protein
MASYLMHEECNRFQNVKQKHDKKDKSGYVYVFADGHGFYKIGKSVDWMARLHSPGFSPYTKVIAILKASNRHQMELELHKKFESKRVKGEWFRLDQQDIKEIRSTYQEQISAVKDSL